MRSIFFVCSVILMCTAPGFIKAGDIPSAKKILIVYLSRTGDTKAIAEIIQHNAGGDLVAIELEKPYPADYKTTIAQVAKENETGFLPPLKTKIDNPPRDF